MTPRVVVTTSWDDGYPADMRVAEALVRHGLTGTFYVPLRNSEGLPVMPATDLRALATGGFEIGGHTLDHLTLSRLDDPELCRQVVDGKRQLEDVLGGPVRGFAYPGGRHGRRERIAVAEAEFDYARTTRMLSLGTAQDPYRMATTLQLYPHRAPAILRNWARQGPSREGLALAAAWLGAGGLEPAVDGILKRLGATGGTFHLWGHSWEIERLDLWGVLDRVLTKLASSSDVRLTNAGVMGSESKLRSAHSV